MFIKSPKNELPCIKNKTMKNYIITLQELFSDRNAEFDQAVANNRVKLVRHKDNRSEIVVNGKIITGYTLYDIYKHDRKTFLTYQGEQSKPVFDNVDYIVAFLGEGSKEARFIGVYKNNGKLHNPSPEYKSNVYDLTEVAGFDILKEKVIIDWGDATICWHQYYSNIKEVIRIEKGMTDANGIPYFKSYNDVNLSFEQLKYIIEREPEDWKVALQAVNCIYMIVDKHNGKQYVGSTYGKDSKKSSGIWNRWSAYVQTGGHGGDVELEELLAREGEGYARNFSWIILETLPLRITDKEAITRENVYKEKFLTREFGYNRN